MLQEFENSRKHPLQAPRNTNWKNFPDTHSYRGSLLQKRIILSGPILPLRHGHTHTTRHLFGPHANRNVCGKIRIHSFIFMIKRHRTPFDDCKCTVYFLSIQYLCLFFRIRGKNKRPNNYFTYFCGTDSKQSAILSFWIEWNSVHTPSNSSTIVREEKYS